MREITREVYFQQWHLAGIRRAAESRPTRPLGAAVCEGAQARGFSCDRTALECIEVCAVAASWAAAAQKGLLLGRWAAGDLERGEFCHHPRGAFWN